MDHRNCMIDLRRRTGKEALSRPDDRNMVLSLLVRICNVHLSRNVVLQNVRSIRSAFRCPDWQLLVITFACMASCTTGRAFIDKTAMDRIYWPGPPERPRISYQWSLSRIAGANESALYEFFVGGVDTDSGDPVRSSQLLRPFSLYVDEQRRLYITDSGAHRFVILDMESGETKSVIRSGEKEFESPVGIAAYGDRIYVSDSQLREVFIMRADGDEIGRFKGEFQRPTLMALDRIRNIIYLSDTLGHRIYIYDLEGNRLGSIGERGSGEGEFNFPTHLWVDSEGRLYVNDAMNFRIQVFSPDGTFKSMFGELGDALGNLEKPKGIASDSDGNIYVVDSINDTVKIFSSKGQLLLFFGQKGRDYGQFWLPSGIFIDGDDSIYVADTYNARVQVFRYARAKNEKEKKK